MPTLLTLPSASTASRAFQTLTATARTHLRTLAGISSSAFFLAFALSPRSFRHPYLLYTSVLVVASRLVVTDAVAPYLFTLPQQQSQQSSTPAASRHPRRDQQQQRAAAAARRMEMSYDMIGSDVHSEATLDSASDRSVEDDSAAAAAAHPASPDNVNGEEVRGEVEGFLKKQAVSTAVAGLGFAMAVVGIWGDGAVTYVSEAFVDVIQI